jgi:hypothetical protein
MKVQFKESIKSLVDGVIKEYGDRIEYVQLTKDEYIQFIHEVDVNSKIILSLPEREYRNVPIKIIDLITIKD